MGQVALDKDTRAADTRPVAAPADDALTDGLADPLQLMPANGADIASGDAALPSGPVRFAGGVGKVGDAYEKHADAVADAVVQGKSVEGMLDAGPGGAAGVQKKAVQMDPGGAPSTAAAAPAAAADPMSTVLDACNTKGDAVGKQKVGEVNATADVPAALKATFFQETAGILAANAGMAPWEAMKKVVSGAMAKYTKVGPPIPEGELKKYGACSRFVSRSGLFKFNLNAKKKAEYMAAANNDEKQAEKLFAAEAMRLGEKGVKSILAGDIGGMNNTGWWAPMTGGRAADLDALITELALNPSWYPDGGVRFTMSAADAGVGTFRKPTPFDGMTFKEWAAAEGGKWGVTAGGSLEAVAAPIPIAKATECQLYLKA